MNDNTILLMILLAILVKYINFDDVHYIIRFYEFLNCII